MTVGISEGRGFFTMSLFPLSPPSYFSSLFSCPFFLTLSHLGTPSAVRRPPQRLMVSPSLDSWHLEVPQYSSNGKENRSRNRCAKDARCEEKIHEGRFVLWQKGRRWSKTGEKVRKWRVAGDQGNTTIHQNEAHTRTNTHTKDLHIYHNKNRAELCRFSSHICRQKTSGEHFSLSFCTLLFITNKLTFSFYFLPYVVKWENKQKGNNDLICLLSAPFPTSHNSQNLQKNPKTSLLRTEHRYTELYICAEREKNH